ncbi:hypothetical protein FRC00_011878 [Tulasnella sp. 408]|nr:hypothetical protein FRC00_011878 [Tulasnella sp. 408]
MGKLKDAILPQPASFAKKKRYELQTVLGTGSFGKVIKAAWTPPEKSESKLVALKVIPKKRVKGNEQAIWSEMSVLDGLDHPNIVESFSLLVQ